MSRSRPHDTSAVHRHLARALAAIDQAAQAIRHSYPQNLSSKEIARLQRRLKARLRPPEARARPGKRAERRISEALADWESGIKGVALYQQHIPQYAQLAHWRRRREQTRLLNAIYKRRQRRRAKPAASTAA